MDQRTRRTLRRLLRDSRGPAAYVVFLAVALTAFLFSMRSCAQQDDAPPGRTEVQITRTTT